MTAVCPICAATGHPWYAQNGRTTLRCSGCGAAWVAEGLALTESGRSIYEDDKPVFFQDGNDAYYLGAAGMINAGVKLDLVRRHAAKGARLLDVGAGFGHFVKAASTHYHTMGTELAPAAVDWASRNLGVELVQASVESLPNLLSGPYDVVTLWDVIEHLDDPRQALMAVAERLEPGGLVILSTPDFSSLAARLLGRRWYYLDPIQHVVLFGRPAMARLLSECGFRVEVWGSMGHAYELDYVLSRLAYLYGRRGAGALLFRPLARLAGLLRGRRVHINPHDVMTVVARRDEA